MLIVFYSETAVLFCTDRQIVFFFLERQTDKSMYGVFWYETGLTATQIISFLAMNGILWHIYLGSQYPPRMTGNEKKQNI